MNNSIYYHRLDDLEQSVINVLRHRNRAVDVSDGGMSPAETSFRLHEQIVAMGSIDIGDDTANSRLMSLLLLSACLRQDKATVDTLTMEILKELQGKDQASTNGEAYLFLSMFFATHNPCFRTAGKRYIQQHPDAPSTLQQLFTQAKRVTVRGGAKKVRNIRLKQQLMDEATENDIFCVSPSDTMTACLTDSQQEYRLCTIEKGITDPLEYTRLKGTRRQEYRPRPTDDTQRLRCLGGMAASRMDPSWLLAAYHLLKARFATAEDPAAQMTILESMYHVAGCEGQLLMQSLKQECDSLFDRHFGRRAFPHGLFSDELATDPLSYRLQSCRYMPMPGSHLFQKTVGSTRWLSALKNWADRLEEQDGGSWHDLSIADSFQLHLCILRTGCLHVAKENKRKAIAYRNRINATSFDLYLQLISSKHPEPAALVSCYHVLRELKPDIATNESRYEEFMRIVAKRQSTLAPASLEWLQLEELLADYKQLNTDRRTYKLVCKDPDVRAFR